MYDFYPEEFYKKISGSFLAYEVWVELNDNNTLILLISAVYTERPSV